MRTLFSCRRLLLATLAPVVALVVACTPMPPIRTTTVPSVDVDRYLGTWYEVGSVKQFFSIGLVNTTAEYSLLPNGWIRVVNRGDFLFPGGPKAAIEGTAVPVDDSNARLNVSFSGSNSSQGLGNYWIVDLDADYRWAIVSDPTGSSGFLLSRTKTVSPELYQELLDRAAAKGVNAGAITRTRQV
jgi:lipocalin